jgi:hypothetical protein
MTEILHEATEILHETTERLHEMTEILHKMTERLLEANIIRREAKLFHLKANISLRETIILAEKKPNAAGEAIGRRGEWTNHLR